MPGSTTTRHARFVSFSGIDGAGKSTQIVALFQRLEDLGLRVQILRFWDDIARLTQLRESAAHGIFKGDRGIGTPSAPINRRDKNIHSLPMTLVRLLIYLLDAISLRRAVQKAIHSGADVVIFDRYIYDELANLTLRNVAIRTYVKLIMTIVPRPQISYLLDADPRVARARKPEYPIEFLNANRLAYLALSDLIGRFTIVPAMPLKVVSQIVINHALDEPPFNDAHQG